jgi:hypothetical protein
MVVTTRYGRTVKQPIRYEPQEVCTDDYSDDEYDDESESDSEEESDSDSESDADEHGNLRNFVTYDDEDEEY